MNTITANIAGEITPHHAACRAAAGQALSHAMDAGRLLAEAKAQVPHGAWLEWLNGNCPDVSERTAQLYMRLHAQRQKLASKAQRVADLTIRAASSNATVPAVLLPSATS